MRGPLNPKARKVGKSSTVTQVTQAVVTGKSKAAGRRDGLAVVEIDGKKITVNDTEAIQAQVDRVLRELGK